MPFAPRPHVELVHVLDMPAKDVLLPGASGPARLITLSESPVNGAISAILDLPPGWSREAGANPETFVEYYLMAGDLLVGNSLQLLPHHYFRTEIDATSGPFSTVHGARVLYFTEGDPAAWRPVADPGADRHDGVFWLDTNTIEWIPSFYSGPPVMDDGARLMTKDVFLDPRTGCHTRLVRAMRGWKDHRTSHHPCVEEMYTLHGHMTYNFGILEVDTYFYRPPRVKHGFFTAYPDGTTWLIRCDGELENIYTESDGSPVNWEYGSDREPIVVSDVTRSARAGAWDGRGQHVLKK